MTSLTKFSPLRPLAALLAVAISSLSVAADTKSRDAREDLLPLFELRPFTVDGGDEISISVYARSGWDRRYATRFAHQVAEAAYITLEGNPGRGLVIMGDSGEPHPMRVFDRFLDVARERGPDSEMSTLAAELETNLSRWQTMLKIDGEVNGSELDIDINELISAFPMPLDGIAAELYLLSWEHRFDEPSVNAELQTLAAEELRSGAFEQFDWVFYLPPRDSLNKILKAAVPAVMKQQGLGPFKRMMVRGAIFTFKPLIKDAMEGLRKGVLYFTVLSAVGEFREGDMEALIEAYVGSQMPRGKIIPGGKQERALEAIREQKRRNDEYAQDPFVAPEPLGDFDANAFAPFAGYYGAEGHQTKRFFVEGDRIYWQEGEGDPVEYLPARERLLVSEKRDITLEFFPASDGVGPSVELRKGRFRFTFPAVE